MTDELGNDGLLEICQVSLESLKDLTLKVFCNATPQRHRFVDCRALTEHQSLRIYEFSKFPIFCYSAVSYVWRGNTPEHPDPADGTFHVEGAEDGDPISIDVLRQACLASIQEGCYYLWLDRLCILQDDQKDKAWQISQMYRIYKDCKTCIILPAGLQCIVTLDKDTAWIHRSWTLQESLAPRKTFVLFSWDLGPGEIKAGDEFGIITEVVRSKSAVTGLSVIVDACVTGKLEFQPHPTQWNDYSGQMVTCKILGHETPSILALGATLNETLAEDPDSRDHAIWKCALMRTSSRPIDMVFSVMGLFGVSLDTRAFGKHERLRATVALAREILRKGGRACWLGLSLDLPLCEQISTFPQFPETSVQGEARVRTADGEQEVAKMMEGHYPVSTGLNRPLPEGQMDDQGYLTFTCGSARAILYSAPVGKTSCPSAMSAPPVTMVGCDAALSVRRFYRKAQ